MKKIRKWLEYIYIYIYQFNKNQRLEVYISRTFNLQKKWGERYLISTHFGDVYA